MLHVAARAWQGFSLQQPCKQSPASLRGAAEAGVRTTINAALQPQVLEDHARPVLSLAVAGDKLFSGSYDYTIKVSA